MVAAWLADERLGIVLTEGWAETKEGEMGRRGEGAGEDDEDGVEDIEDVIGD